VIAPLSLFSPVRTDVVAQYPDLAPLRRAVKSKDWRSVSDYFGIFPARADQSLAVRLVADSAGSERFLQRVVDSDRDSSLARTLLGARLIVMAWNARGAYYARYVSQAQWRLFGEHLQHAERVLGDATAIDPTNAAAWTQRITTARGLSLGTDEARRRYERVAEHCDAPYAAQAQLLQNLCPKWGGSLAEIHAFANECLAQAKVGSLGGAVVAHAHVEHAFTSDYMSEVRNYLGQRKVREELAAAAAHTVLHPDFQPTHGEVAANTVFTYAFCIGGDYVRAARHFAVLRNRSTDYPWSTYNAKNWKAVVRQARRKSRRP
jgi:hypothetical protein